MSHRFDPELQLRFIDTYKELACLWNKSAPGYRNQKTKYQALKTLLAIIKDDYPEATVETVIRRVESLRACHRKERLRLESHKNMKKPLLWYYDKLSFLNTENVRRPVYKDNISETRKTKPKQKKKVKSNKKCKVRQIKTDMENYVKYKLFGGNLRLKKGVLPHKFACQKPKQPEKAERTAVLKRRKIELINKILNEDIPSTTSYNIEEVFIENSAPDSVKAEAADPLQNKKIMCNEDNSNDKNNKIYCSKKVQLSEQNMRYINRSTMIEEKYLKIKIESQVDKIKKEETNDSKETSSVSTITAEDCNVFNASTSNVSDAGDKDYDIILMQESEEDDHEIRYDDDNNEFDQSEPSYSLATSLVEVSDNSKQYQSYEEDSKAKRHCTEVEDEFDAIGINVAAKLRYLPQNMQILAEKLINDVLFQAQLNGLNASTVISTSDPFKQEHM